MDLEDYDDFFDPQDPELRAFLKALANDGRRRLLLYGFPDGRPHTVSEIASRLEMKLSTTSENLKILKDGGLVRAERYGKQVWYRPARGSAYQRYSALGEYMSFCLAPNDQSR